MELKGKAFGSTIKDIGYSKWGIEAKIHLNNHKGLVRSVPKPVSNTFRLELMDLMKEVLF